MDVHAITYDERKFILMPKKFFMYVFNIHNCESIFMLIVVCMIYILG